MEKDTVFIQKIKEDQIFEKQDEVALEQPYEIVLRNGQRISGTCTPTHMEELILAERYLEGDFTDEELALVKKTKAPLESVKIEEIFRVANDCFEHPGSLFADTGCAHSCALIHKGNVVCQMEDIGRYNAQDKVIGYALEKQIPFKEAYIFASGRISLGYIQKATAAGFSMVVSRAAVTKAAVDYAKENHVTLIGFIRKNSGNIYNVGSVKLDEQSR